MIFFLFFFKIQWEFEFLINLFFFLFIFLYFQNINHLISKLYFSSKCHWYACIYIDFNVSTMCSSRTNRINPQRVEWLARQLVLSEIRLNLGGVCDFPSFSLYHVSHTYKYPHTHTQIFQCTFEMLDYYFF